jgi:hypothetical protein
MSAPNPYAAALGNRDALTALGETPERIRALVQGWPADRWEKTYAPGKWTARQILTHMAQTELALTTRARFAASATGYTAQPFSQDDWIALDSHADAHTALDAYLALRKFNLAMFRNLTAEQRDRPFSHPEHGELTPLWIAAQLAGHDLHHLAQLQQIA